MSEAFDIAVRVSPEQTLPTIDKIEKGLAKAEKEAKLLRDTLSGMGRQMASGMSSMSDAIEIEARMLERATGRARDFGYQLAALQKLHREGKISGEQYIQTLQKMGVEMDKTAKEAEELARAQAKQAAQTISLPGQPQAQGLGSKLSGLASGAGPALGIAGGIAAAATAADHFIHEAHEMEDRVTSLTNAASKFTDQFGSANATIEAQRGLAASLHATIGQTVNAFDDVGDATSHLNLSTAEQVQLTQNLGRAAALAGNSLDSVGGTLQGLSVAFQTGGDASKQLRTLFKEMPELGDQLVENLHMSKAEIVDAVKAGKLNFEDFVHAMSGSSGAIDTSFQRIKQTHVQWEASFKESMELAAASGKSAFDSLEAGIAQADAAFEASRPTFQRWFYDLQQGLAQIESAAGRKAISGFQDVTGAITDLIATGQDYVGMAARAAGITDEWRVESEKHAVAVDKEAAALRKLMLEESKRRNIAVPRETRSAADPGMVQPMDLHVQAPESQWLGETQDSADLFHPNNAPVGNTVNIANAANGFGVSSDFAISLETAKDPAKEANQEIADSAKKAANETAEAWSSAAGEMAASLIKAAQDGSLSFDDLSMQIAKVALQMAAMQAGGPYGAFLSSLVGGFAHGGSYTIPKSPDWFTMPHAAHGNSWEMGGGGGADDHMFMARVSSGERVDVLTRQQQLAEANWMRGAERGRGGSGAAKVTNQIVVRSDPREVTRAMGSYSGQREFVDLNRQFNRRR